MELHKAFQLCFFLNLNLSECFTRISSQYHRSPFQINTKLQRNKIYSQSNQLYSKNEEEEEEEDPLKAWKEQYPDLEFVDYSDPDYVVDQGVESTIRSSKEQDEAEIEEMREERRRKNDEFQYETYFKNAWSSGSQAYFGDWTVYDYKDMTLRKRIKTPRVISMAKKVQSKRHKVQGLNVIMHQEDLDDDEDDSDEEEALLPYWPEELNPFDFRGPQGVMTVGNAYTICDTEPLLTSDDNPNNLLNGPFEKMRAELGIFSKDTRLRLKLSYAIEETDYFGEAPSLFLKSVTVCRESFNDFPSSSSHPSLYDGLGAPGGLYDPPPIADAQQGQYLMLDLEGNASALFPSQINQDNTFGKNGWVMTLDWTTDVMRYQVDRKVFGGSQIKSLYRLELSEVQGKDADKWRPRSGPEDMRQ